MSSISELKIEEDSLGHTTDTEAEADSRALCKGKNDKGNRPQSPSVPQNGRRAQEKTDGQNRVIQLSTTDQACPSARLDHNRRVTIMKSETDEENNTPKRAIGSATPIQIGMVIGFMAAFGGIVWGAATMNAKLDVVLANMRNVEDNNKGLRSELNGLLIWKAEIDRSGSKAVDDLKKEFELFKSEFQIHVAATATKR